MAKVRHGAHTTKSTQPQAAAPAAAEAPQGEAVEAEAAPAEGDADRIKAAVEEDQQESGVCFEADIDGHLYIVPPKAKMLGGERVGMDQGLFLDFLGVGRTKPFHPDDNSRDKEFVDKVLAQIKDKNPDCVEHNIRLRTGDKAPMPSGRWNTLNPGSLRGFIEAQLSENNEANVKFVKRCAQYELENLNRKEVLAMLDAVMVNEASMTDAFDVEVSLH